MPVESSIAIEDKLKIDDPGLGIVFVIDTLRFRSKLRWVIRIVQSHRLVENAKRRRHQRPPSLL